METSRKTADGTPGDKGSPDQPDERTLREERILDAAAALLVRWGYRKTSIDDVAREAGIGQGTIYLHWKSKNDLFRAAIWRANQQVSEDLQQRIADDPEGGLPHRLWMHSMLAALGNPLDINHGAIVPDVAASSSADHRVRPREQPYDDRLERRVVVVVDRDPPVASGRVAGLA